MKGSLNGHHINISFKGEDLRDRVLSGTFVSCTFEDADLRGADLCGEFIECSFDGAKLDQDATGIFLGCNFRKK